MAYCKKFDIDETTAFRLAYGFGGGIGATGELCGAVSAATMLLSLKYVTNDITNIENKEIAKSKIRVFMSNFKVNHKKVNCRNILTEDMPQAVHKRHSEKCLSVILEVCDLLEKEL